MGCCLLRARGGLWLWARLQAAGGARLAARSPQSSSSTVPPRFTLCPLALAWTWTCCDDLLRLRLLGLGTWNLDLGSWQEYWNSKPETETWPLAALRSALLLAALLS
jgi:hypothetical protein